jgi:hypothetical protein
VALNNENPFRSDVSHKLVHEGLNAIGSFWVHDDQSRLCTDETFLESGT